LSELSNREDQARDRDEEKTTSDDPTTSFAPVSPDVIDHTVCVSVVLQIFDFDSGNGRSAST
jgi:hypothetical protein